MTKKFFKLSLFSDVWTAECVALADVSCNEPILDSVALQSHAIHSPTSNVFLVRDALVPSAAQHVWKINKQNCHNCRQKLFWWKDFFFSERISDKFTFKWKNHENQFLRYAIWHNIRCRGNNKGLPGQRDSRLCDEIIDFTCIRIHHRNICHCNIFLCYSFCWWNSVVRSNLWYLLVLFDILFEEFEYFVKLFCEIVVRLR